MKKMVAAWVFLISVLFIAILYFGYSYIDSIAEYQTLESDMIESADFYLTLNKIKLSVGETLRIDAKDLIAAKMLSSMETENDECVGYVEVKKSISGNDYKAYIKCKNYTSEGYEE